MLAIVRRHLVTILSPLSLLLCLAVAADWSTHPWRTNRYGFKFDGLIVGGVVLVSGDSVLGLYLDTSPVSRATPGKLGPFYRVTAPRRWFFFRATGPLAPILPPDSWLERRGFWFKRYTDGGPREGYFVTLPSWFVIALLSILPAVRFRAAWRARRHRREGLCRVCGYDLRAHSPGDRCPECGTSVPAPRSGNEE